MTAPLDTLLAHADDAWAATCDCMALKPADAHTLTRQLIAALEAPGVQSAPRGYTDLPAEFHVRASASMRDARSPVSSRLLDLILVELIREFDTRYHQAALPESLLPYYRENISRILSRATQSGVWTGSSHDDIFLKDLGILRMWLIPCASHLVFRNSGVPRSLVLRQRPDALIRALAFFALRAGGFSPFLENHVHPQMLVHFNPEGRQRCYELVAELLQRWPDSRGLMGLSWYYDPAVRTLSPRLAYLRNGPEQHGALFLPAGSGADVVGGATSTSVTRRTLYEAGAYMPTRYLMAWPRKDLLRLASP